MLHFVQKQKIIKFLVPLINRMSNIQNLQTFDPFADASKGADDDVQDGLVHIRIQQRNGRKTLTTVQGLSKDYDLKKIVRACKKVRDFLLDEKRKLCVGVMRLDSVCRL